MASAATRSGLTIPLPQPGAETQPTGALLGVLCRAGLAIPGDRPIIEPLIGGVSSDIWRVDLAPGPVCVKRALAKLKVKADWQAPVERNLYEARWMQIAALAAPSAVPRLIHLDLPGRALVMEYLDPATHRLWKTELRYGRAESDFAAAVGRVLAAVHASTAICGEIAAQFPTDPIFRAIRLEPYLAAAAAAHPALEPALQVLVRRTAATKLALVHGDVSPKNILAGPRGPVLLDAECACYGDPAFDLAFCLNHLLLKCLWTPSSTPALLACFAAMADRYLAGVVWERRERLEARAARLLPGLLLARIDGKSPVEYITAEADKEFVRAFATTWLTEPPGGLETLRDDWHSKLAARSEMNVGVS